MTKRKAIISRSLNTRLIWSVITTTFVILILAPNALAQTLGQNDINSIYNNTVWYDTSSLAGSNSCAANVTPGNGAPDGAAFPNLDPKAMASAINAWITQQNPNSELRGLGSTIVADGKSSNINPFLIVAIAKKESSLSDPSDVNVSNGNNSFGRTAAPGQPSFQGSKLWYKWSSVGASVDNTAPENKNAVGGGDMAAYIRDQYGSQIDSNNLMAMFVLYAPPGPNNTAQYIAQVQSWITDLVNLTNGAVSTSNTDLGLAGNGCIGSTTCSNGATTTVGVNAAILCEAEKYAGIYYHLGGGHISYSAFRQQCPETAIRSAEATSTAFNPGPCATDCSGLISVAVDAVYNKAYVWTVSDNDGTMQGGGAQFWQSIPIAQAQAGDIVTTDSPDGHVEIVDHVSGSTIYTFGSHHTGTQTGSISTSTSYWVTGAWRWMAGGQ